MTASRRVLAAVVPLAVLLLAAGDILAFAHRAVQLAQGRWLLTDLRVPIQRSPDACGLYCLVDLSRLAGRALDADAVLRAHRPPRNGFSSAELQRLSPALALRTHIVAFADGVSPGSEPLVLLLPRRHHFVVYEGRAAAGLCVIYDPVAGRALTPCFLLTHQAAPFAIALDKLSSAHAAASDVLNAENSSHTWEEGR